MPCIAYVNRHLKSNFLPPWTTIESKQLHNQATSKKEQTTFIQKYMLLHKNLYENYNIYFKRISLVDFNWLVKHTKPRTNAI